MKTLSEARESAAKSAEDRRLASHAINISLRQIRGLIPGREHVLGKEISERLIANIKAISQATYQQGMNDLLVTILEQQAPESPMEPAPQSTSLLEQMLTDCQ
jgi:hydroxypyruvate isomerase